MVIWNVATVAEKAGVKTALDLAEKAGLNKNTAAALMGGRTARVDRDTLTKVCKALNCVPGDLLVWEPGDEKITRFNLAGAFV